MARHHETQTVIELSDSDGDDAYFHSQTRPRKRQRNRGTQEDPISLSDSEPPQAAHQSPARSPTTTLGVVMEDPFDQDSNQIPGQYPEDFTDGFEDNDLPNDAHEGMELLLDVPDIPEQSQQLTEQQIFEKIRQMFPDICRERLLDIVRENAGDIESVLETILEGGNYPKEREKMKVAKSPKEDVNTGEQWRVQVPVAGKLRLATIDILKRDFPTIPIGFINTTLKDHGNLFPSYHALEEAQNTVPLPWNRSRTSALSRADMTMILRKYGAVAIPLEKELFDARKTCVAIRAKRAEDKAKQAAEEANLQDAYANGAVTECLSCFDTCPLNRAIHCDGPLAHYLCMECASTFVTTQVGESRCDMECAGDLDCRATYADSQLRLLPDQRLTEKLFDLRQEKEVRDACIEDLAECPFCDFKAVCPPIEVDFEFRCLNSECSEVSCRKCSKHTHVPLSCEEYAQQTSKDQALTHRRRIEEAMTDALIRSCNKCKRPFIKEYGCNKMTCSSCHNTQCYVCSANVQGNYNHFDQGPTGAANRASNCPLYDNVEERHQKDVAKAESDARAAVLHDHPDVAAEFLEFQVSERINQDEQALQRRLQARRPAVGPHNLIFGPQVVIGAQLRDRVRVIGERGGGLPPAIPLEPPPAMAQGGQLGHLGHHPANHWNPAHRFWGPFPGGFDLNFARIQELNRQIARDMNNGDVPVDGFGPGGAFRDYFR